jgi:hypothetical protein
VEESCKARPKGGVMTQKKKKKKKKRRAKLIVT